MAGAPAQVPEAPAKALTGAESEEGGHKEESYQ
jgi:hypothetical protein